MKCKVIFSMPIYGQLNYRCIDVTMTRSTLEPRSFILKLCRKKYIWEKVYFQRCFYSNTRDNCNLKKSRIFFPSFVQKMGRYIYILHFFKMKLFKFITSYFSTIKLITRWIKRKQIRNVNKDYNVNVEQFLKECSILFIEQIHKVIFQKMY